MTVTASTSRASYSGNGVSTVFTIPFRILDQSHIDVILTDADGTEHTLALTTDYSVSGVGGTSSTLTMMVAPPIGKTLTILRDVPLTQEKDYVTGDKFPAESHEQALDKLTMALQQLGDTVTRSVKLPRASTLDPEIAAVLPTPRNGYVLGFDANGALVTIDAGAAVSVPADVLTKSGNLANLASKIASVDNLTVNGADIASAATLDLDSATGDEVKLTGNVTITAVTLAAGRTRWAQATGTATLQVGASLVGNGGGSDVVLAAGDMVKFRGYAAGLVKFQVFRATGKGTVPPAFADLTAKPTTVSGYGITDLVFPPGFLFGLGLANSAGDATNDIDIAAGKCRDSTDTTNLILAAGITKRLDAAWAVGTGNGGLSTGSIANTTYHVHLVKRLDTGVVDVIFDVSATAPTLPANYLLFRRVGSIVRASAAILAFIQDRDNFYWNSGSLTADYNASSTRAKAALTVNVPSGIRVEGVFQWGFGGNAPGTTTDTYFDGVNTSIAKNASGGNAGSGGNGAAKTVLTQFTNTSAQIQFQTAPSGGGGTTTSTTLGWIDTRGR